MNGPILCGDRHPDRRKLLLSLGAVPLASSLALQFPGIAWSAASGPLELLISYRCDVDDRPAFRNYLSGSATARFEIMKQSGVIKGYQFLFNPFTSAGTWDALVILTFAQFGDTQKWKDVERTMPGGLDADGLKLARPIQTYSCDLAWEATAPDPGAETKRVAYVIPYIYNSLPVYKDYVDGYVIPQVKGWMKEGILSRYRIYLNRFSVGDPWDALFIYEYRDLENFGHREDVLAKVRGTLKADPNWSHLSEIKATIRSETENTIADILARP